MINPFKKWFGTTEPSENKTDPNDMSLKSLNLTMDQVQRMFGDSNTQPLKLEAVWSCLRDKSETAGMIPMKLYSMGKDGTREQIHSGRTHRIFTQQPCDYMTMQEFIEFGVFWLERRGAFYAYKVTNDRGNVSQIIPFMYQSNVTPNFDINGEPYYTYTTNDGKSVTNYRIEDLFIVRGMTSDGISPLSPFDYQASLLGVAKAQQDNYEQLQKNGITSQMALSTDNIFNDTNSLTRLQEDWAKYRGSSGIGAVPIFENGIKPVSLKLTPQETELLGHQEFTVNRICRMFRVPLHRIGAARNDDGDTTTIFDLDEAYMRNNIMPQLNKFRAQFNKIAGDKFDVEFNVKAYYAGSPWRIGEAVDKVVKGGLVSINEGRSELGYDRVEGADVFAVDNNNVVYSEWDKLKEAQQMIYNQTNNQNSESDEPTDETTQGDDQDE